MAKEKIDKDTQEENMTYEKSGVSYTEMDPFKRAAQDEASRTDNNIARLSGGKYRVVKESRGESVFLIETPENYLAHVEEGLGTKNLVADAMLALTGASYFNQIAQDCVAMIVNDMATLGALPLSVAMHLAVGDSAWFDNKKRYLDLIYGWKDACDLAGCVWGGGETPTLKDVVYPSPVVLSGSAMGIIEPKERKIDARKIAHKDRIILIESNGIQANGLTLARQIADKLPNDYLTCLSDGRMYGEALLDPTHIYVSLVENCLDAEIDLHYAVNITGHGWRKLMRTEESFMYVIEKIPKPQPIFDFIAENGPVSDEEMYGNYNMGAGFAFFVPEKEVEKVIDIAKFSDFEAFDAGYIHCDSNKRVVIEPKNLTYHSDSLDIR